MFKHVLCMKMRDFGDAPAVKEKLLSLMDAVEVIRECECAVDELRTPRSYDLIWITVFESRADYEKYLVHPAHIEVSSFVRSVLDESVAIDYEL